MTIMTPKFKKTLKKLYKINRDNHDTSNCAENARIRTALNRAQNGKIGVIISGMDCDCTRYRRESIQTVWGSVMAFKVSEKHRLDWLDGTENQYLVPPSTIEPENNYSHDLALESYENGHAHVVYG